MSKYLLSDDNSNFLEPTVTQYGSSMVMTNVNKPRKTMYLNIDTKFTDDYDKHANISTEFIVPEKRLTSTKLKKSTVIELEKLIEEFSIPGLSDDQCEKRVKKETLILSSPK